MKWWQNFLRGIARNWLEQNKQPIEDTIVGLVDSVAFETAVAVKKKFPEIPESVLIAMREEIDRQATERVDKAIDELINKLKE